MVMNKRGQLFLLAAVIISMVVLSLGVTINRAIVTSEPEEFYEFSYEVKRESSAALDYEIYTVEDDEGGSEIDLEEFIITLTENVRNKEPDANFVIIYGSTTTGITITGEWDDDVSTSTISYGGSFVALEDDEIDTTILSVEDLIGVSEIVVEIGGESLSFSITEYYQIIFIIQKDVEDEVYIAVG